MPVLHLPVRYYRDFDPHHDHVVEELLIKSEETAFLLIDVDGLRDPAFKDHARASIAPALKAARELGLLIVYVHNDWRLASDFATVAWEVWRKTKQLSPEKWQRGTSFTPDYLRELEPREHEANFPKWSWSGFHQTALDQHLRGNEIRNLIAVGYNLRACVYQTLVDAVARNYRVVALRDATKASEMPDTRDERLEEGGWMTRIFVRQIEHLLGQTATVADFTAACDVAKMTSV